VSVVRRIARTAGIVAVFSLVGPIAIATLITLIVVAFGAALLQLVLSLVDFAALRAVISVAVWLLAALSALAFIAPSTVTGVIFGLAAVYGGRNTLWMAWIAAAVTIVGFIACGIVFIPAESSAVILPSVRSASQALALFVMLAGLAVVPTSLCWWLAKPLHRARIAA
jgi:peptidoglycan/LPS O-acetylase OafA/YrhL